MFIQGFFFEIKSVIFSLNVLDCYLSFLTLIQISHCRFIPTHSLQISCDVRKLFLATIIILMKCTQWYLLQEQKNTIFTL